MTTIREQIIALVLAYANTLTSSTVYRCLRSINDTENEFISIWDGDDETKELNYGEQTLEFPIAIEWIIKVDENTNPSILANEKMGIVVKTLYNIIHDAQFETLATGFKYASSSPTYPADGIGYVVITVGFLIEYMIKEGDPTATPHS